MARMFLSERSEAGFTLLEALVTITIIGILGAISYPPLISTMAKYNFRAAGRGVMNATMQVRSFAVRDNNDWRVAVNPGANSFSLVNPDLSAVETFDVSSYGAGIRLVESTDTTCGAATKNWDDVNIDPAVFIEFTGRGFGNNRTIYLEDTKSGACCAVTATLAGAIRLRRYNGKTPFAVANWD